MPARVDRRQQRIPTLQVKQVLNRHKRRDPWFLDDYSINPYVGCPFNCLYCYVRGSRYGINHPERFAVKENAPELLDRELRRRANRGEYGIIALATATEPYPKAEEELRITRQILELLLKYRFPVHILTKSTGVLRDLDLLQAIDRTALLPVDLQNTLSHGVILNLSFSTVDDTISRRVEPGAPTPTRRFKVIQEAKHAGLWGGASLIPALPFLSDTPEHLQSFLQRAKESGADFVFVGALTLFGAKPHDSKNRYFQFLEKFFPEWLPPSRTLFRRSSQPPKSYQRRLLAQAQTLCQKLGLQLGLTQTFTPW